MILNFAPFRASSTALAAIVLMMSAYTTCAWGEEPRRSSAEQARILITKGNLALRKGDEVMARKHYRESFELQESFDAVCNLGGVEAQSKLYEEAYEHLQLCLQLYPEDPDLAETRDKIEAKKNEVRAELTQEQAREADIRVVEYLDNRPRLDDEPTDETRNADAAPPPSARAETTDSSMEKANSPKLPVVIGLGVVGLAGVGVGVGFHFKAAGHESTADDVRTALQDGGDTCAGAEKPPGCEDLQDSLDKTTSSRTVRNIGFIAGGTFLAASVLTYVLWPEPRSGSTAHYRPMMTAGPGGWAFGFTGSF